MKGGRLVGCYIWYSEEGLGGAAARGRRRWRWWRRWWWWYSYLVSDVKLLHHAVIVASFLQFPVNQFGVRERSQTQRLDDTHAHTEI